MHNDDYSSAIRILAKWNMAPIEPSDEIPDPERSRLDIDKSFVAVDGTKIVGVCSYILHSPELAETASLAIDPEYGGHGVGLQLQRARIAEMKQLGVRKVRTETDRQKTVNWYIRKCGYRRVGTNPKKHSFSLEDVDEWTVLELDLEG